MVELVGTTAIRATVVELVGITAIRATVVELVETTIFSVNGHFDRLNDRMYGTYWTGSMTVCTELIG